MKRKYYVCIDSTNTSEAFKAVLSLLNKFGKVLDVRTEGLQKDPDTNEEIGNGIDIFTLKTSKRRFDKMRRIFKESGYELTEIRGYWFM